MPTRYQHSGNAVATTISTSITNSSTTINITSATGWPDGSVGPFWATLDRGTASEERILVLSRSGTALTVQTRGADGTTATTHNALGSIEHTASATEVDEANQAAVLLGSGYGLNPAATVIWSAGSATPAGYLPCDGAAVSRTTYSALYSAIGTTFGAGDGSTTFNVPNLKGRMILGAGAQAGLTTRTRGQTGGAEDAVVVSHSHSHSHGASSGNQSVDHSHTVNSHSHGGATGGQSANHSHTLGISDAGGLGGGGSLVRKGGVSGDVSGGASNDHSHGIGAEAPGTSGVSASHSHAVTVNADATAAGVSGTGANMPPFIVLTPFIKT